MSATSGSDPTQISPASIQTSINGTTAGIGGINPAAAPSTSACGNWVQVTQTWSSGANTTATIVLTDVNTAAIGNDFALDDISFTTSATCPLTDSLKITYECIMPVSLVYFKTVRQSAGIVQLSWSTVSEQNSSRFVIQRSTDDQHWTDIGTVNAAGNSSIRLNYTYTDESASGSTLYYRLQEVDFNGTYEYSPESMISAIDAGSGAITIYPNPASTTARITLSQASNQPQWLQLLNYAGQIIAQQAIAPGTFQIDLDITQLAQGTYIIKLTGGGQVQCRKLSVL